VTPEESALHDRIRELCTRVTMTEGAEFQLILADLAKAIESWNTLKNDDGRGSS
jgi:hypothetical protein